ncbi:MAG: Na+/H+ antiporter NhaA [Chromatiaceae bacterium]
MVSTWLQDFMKQDSAGGIVLVFAALCAMLIKNSPLDWVYDALLQTPVAVRVGAFEIYKPLLLWINDGLMAVFFLLIGLEVKREILEGELSSPSQIVLPAFGAVGGMAVPALLYVWLNWGDAAAIDGWAIPAATDIAFSLGVLALLGKRIPLSLRVFLLALAIFDDLGAIVVIALFYTSELSYGSLVAASVALGVLLVLNLLHVTRLSAYVLVGVVLWVSVLKSGVHATLAGVALGFAIPLRTRLSGSYSPLRQLEHDLHPWVAFAIVPVFAFANAGVSLHGISLDVLLGPVPLGIAGGLFLGKQVGIMLFCGVVIALGWARLPAGATWTGFYGVSVLCGIGFTMSLFITSLAFEHAATSGDIAGDRLGILLGSALSAVAGYLLLRIFRPSRSGE